MAFGINKKLVVFDKKQAKIDVFELPSELAKDEDYVNSFLGSYGFDPNEVDFYFCYQNIKITFH